MARTPVDGNGRGRYLASRLVFIDETWAKDNMTPLRGWCRRGERLKAKAPFGRWKTMTFIAALRQDRIDAPCLFDGPINGEGIVSSNAPAVRGRV